MNARLICRLPEQSDLDAIFALYTDPRTSALSPLAALDSLADVQEMLNEWCQHWQAHDFGPWVIALQEAPNQVIGCGGISLRDFLDECLPNLWYRFVPSVWGRGYASEFVSAALGHFQNLGRYDEVHALVLPNNVASIRVLEKSGLRVCGVLPSMNGKEASLHYCMRL